VAVSEGDFYQCLLGGDVLSGKPGILGPATIQMSSHNTVGNVQWRQLKGGCIAIADLIHPTASVNPADVLPPPPPSAQTQVQKTTLKKEGVTLSGA
jgi:hypothetical protein